MVRNAEVSLEQHKNENAPKTIEKKVNTINGELEILSINEHTWEIFLDTEVINQLKMDDSNENCKNWSPAKCPNWCM